MIKASWLVVSTPLKNISQWEGLSHILWKIKNVPNHQPASKLYLQAQSLSVSMEIPGNPGYI
jgi:hypothetical protein